MNLRLGLIVVCVCETKGAIIIKGYNEGFQPTYKYNNRNVIIQYLGFIYITQGFFQGLTCPSPSNKCCHQHLTNHGCFCMKNSPSHVTSSTGRFFHLTRYLVITQFHRILILVSRIVSGSSMIFPFSLMSSKVVQTRILSPITLFKQ